VEDLSLITEDGDEKECSEAVTEEGGETHLSGGESFHWHEGSWTPSA